MPCTLSLPPIPALQPGNTRQLEFSLGIIPTVLLSEVSGCPSWPFFDTPLQSSPHCCCQAITSFVLYFALFCISKLIDCIYTSQLVNVLFQFFCLSLFPEVHTFLSLLSDGRFLGYNLKHLFLILLNILDMQKGIKKACVVSVPFSAVLSLLFLY